MRSSKLVNAQTQCNMRANVDQPLIKCLVYLLSGNFAAQKVFLLVSTESNNSDAYKKLIFIITPSIREKFSEDFPCSVSHNFKLVNLHCGFRSFFWHLLEIRVIRRSVGKARLMLLFSFQ